MVLGALKTMALLSPKAILSENKGVGTGFDDAWGLGRCLSGC